MNYIKKLLFAITRSKAFIVVGLLATLLLIPSIFAASKNESPKEKKAEKQTLGVVSKPSPTPTVSPSPTPVLLASKITLTPTPLPTSTPTPAPTSNSNSSSPTPTNTPTPTPAPTATPTPTPQALTVEIGIDYGGQRDSDTYTASINAGQTAWEVVSSAVGIGNLQYTDYGGDLGIFITGFNGVNAASNQFYEFRVNGASSMVGVSTYQVNSGDQLDFVLTTF